MADDQNRSNNRRGMNSFADDIDRSSFLSELERIGARASRKSIQRTELEERIRGEGKLLNSLLDEGRRTPNFQSSPFYQEQTSALRESIRGIRTRMNTLDTSARTRAESEASTYIARQFSGSSINGQISGMQREAAVQNRAFSMSNQSYDELESRRQDILADIRVRERNAQNEVKGMFSGRGQVDPEKSAAIGVMMGGAQDQFRQLAMINAAQAFQRASGNDPNSKMKSLAEMGMQAQSLMSAEAIAKEVKSGGIQISQNGRMGTVANEDVSRELVNQARILAQTLKELGESAGKTDEELSKLRATADESADNMKKLQDAQKAGAGNNGFNGVNLAMGLAGGFNAAGMAAQQILVGQRMQQVANTTGFANLANQQYDMYAKARGGDIASQLALTQFGEADQFGMEMKRGTNVAQTGFLLGGAAQTTAGVLQAGNAAKNMGVSLGLTGSQEFMQGTQNALQGAATTAIVGSDMLRGTSAQAARLAGVQAQMQARMAINQVGARQAQGLRDFYTNLDVVGQEMGGRSSGFIQNAISDGNMQRMIGARLSPEQFAQMSQFGAANMGSTFGVDQVFAARNLESRGYGNMQTNMQRMATLAGAGANNPKESMEGVLSAAVRAGLDSSKAISMMVDNTASIASASAGAMAGIDTTGAVSSMLAGNLNPNIANKEFALQQAMSAAERTNQTTTNRDVSFTGMANTAGLQMALQRKGIAIGGDEAIGLQGVDIATLKSLQNNPKKAAEFFQNRGVNISEGNANEALSTIIREKQIQNVRPAAQLEGLNAADVVDKMTKGTLTPEEKRKLGLGANLGGRVGFDELERETLGIKKDIAPNTVGKDLTEGKGPDDLKKQMDNLRTSGFKQLSEAASFASDNLKQFGGALKVFTDLQQKFEKGGKENEKEFSTAASDFAKNFSTSTKLFNDSVGNFDLAVTRLINNAGLRSNGIPAVPNQVTDMLDKVKGSTRGN